jgi:putative oxygen-independent coproporphyrinogen III oxidase
MISLGEIPLGLYVHLPWCIRKCPYCDFNSHEKSGELPFERYVDSLLADLQQQVGTTGGRTLTSIFIGGGTPSLFPTGAIRQLMDGIRNSVSCDPNIEVTLEANPGAADAARFAGYLDAGVNRLSIGVQSFRDRQLSLLGRVHSADDARQAYLAARRAGFSNVNIDIMHGLPEDDVEQSLSDIRSAVELQPEHISWYQLTIEPSTAFARNPPQLPMHDDIAEQFDRGRELLESAGYSQYEISAYATTNSQSRHNLNYWEFGDYLGIGAGAHGKLTTDTGIFRTEKRRGPATYMSQAGGADSDVLVGPIEDTALVGEFAINALRLRRGYRETLFSERTGLCASLIESPLATAVNRGWLTRDRGIVQPTELGFRFLDDVQLLFLS